MNLYFVAFLIAAEFVEVHGPNGQHAYINPSSISSLREPSQTDLRHYFVEGSKCVVVTTDGKFLSVRETCAEIHNMIEHNKVRH